jgi:hypothetical protein
MKTPKVEVKPKEVNLETQSAKDARELLLQESDAAFAEQMRLQKRYTELHQKIKAKDFSEQEESLLVNEFAETNKSLKQLWENGKSKLRRHLYVNNQSGVTGEVLGEMVESNRLNAMTAMDEFRKMVSSQVVTDGSVAFRQTPSTRAYFSALESTVYIPKEGRNVSTFLHEAGHWLEVTNESVREKVFAFYKRRTKGYPLVNINGYSSGELTRLDDFMEPYMGKEYSGSDGELQATEILSMGLEYFYQDPARLAEEDPDYFDFIFDLLRGR